MTKRLKLGYRGINVSAFIAVSLTTKFEVIHSIQGSNEGEGVFDFTALYRNQCEIQLKSQLTTNRKSYELSISAKVGDLE